MKYKISGLFLSLLLLITAFTNVKAEEINVNKTGSLSVNLSDVEHKKPIENAKLALYYIASLQVDSSGSLTYIYADKYKDCDVSLDNPNSIETLDTLTHNNQYSFIMTTDHKGNASVSNLPLGVYFVKQINSVEGYAECKSFLVTIPIKENNTYIYDVNAMPKTETEKLISITIEKIWKTQDNAKLPKEVTIQLYKDHKVIKTAVLNQSNNWKIEYSQMEKSDTYYIKEINIPNGYTPVYNQNDYKFTVINVSSLINTGQLIWPIPILTISGIIFITTGLIVLRKKGYKHD